MLESVLGFLGNMGGPEILLILFVILLFFGAKKLPELARGLGRGIREFKEATREIRDEIEQSVKEEPKR
ncbi:MAG: twin-arginine translocase TatA/TatE family subunit [Cytophagales bacterium]|nr:twin-arginine translocase TatA/TatE family subunit [Bernardetiaceae bacterium]MDW8210352.1 twin-arginine translocase TatA/TatE family subunit [Cytophagales bacterium]